MIKVIIKRYNGVPIIREGKVVVTQERFETTIEEKFDDFNVMDKSKFRQDTISKAAVMVRSFNVQEEEKAKRDRSNPKKRIRKLVISNIV